MKNERDALSLTGAINYRIRRHPMFRVIDHPNTKVEYTYATNIVKQGQETNNDKKNHKNRDSQ